MGEGSLLLDEAFTPEQRRLRSPGQFRAFAGLEGTLHVMAADPVVWFTGSLLVKLHDRDHHPDVSLECGCDWSRCRDLADVKTTFTGDIIRVRAPEGLYIYVVGSIVTGHPDVWELRWPD